MFAIVLFSIWTNGFAGQLSSHYPFPDPVGLSSPMVLIGVIGLRADPLLLISLVDAGAMTGFLIFFVAIAPTLQTFQFSNVIASDKFAYLPSIGILMILARFWSGYAASTAAVNIKQSVSLWRL